MSGYENSSADGASPPRTGVSTPDTLQNESSTPPATYVPGYRYVTNPYGPGSGIESGQGIPHGEPQPEDATPTNPWPVNSDLVNAILAEVQTRFRLLAQDNLRPMLTNDEIGAALYDAIDTVNNFPPATQFTIDQLFMTGADPRFRGVYYLAVAQKLLNTILWDNTANGFSQQFNNFTVENRLGDYQQLQSIITEQLDAQLERLKTSTQKYLKRVLPANQSLIRPYGSVASRGRPLGGGGGNGGYFGNGGW